MVRTQCAHLTDVTMSTVIPSIKQFLTWALAVIGPVVATLMKSLKVTCSSGASRFTNHAVRIITSASSPEYYSRRKHISAFFLGFLLGSFLYLTVHNFRYAWYYDNKVLPVVVNHVGQTRFTGRTTGHPVTLYTTTRGRSTSRRPARPLLTSGVTMLVHQAWPDTMVPESVRHRLLVLFCFMGMILLFFTIYFFFAVSYYL